MSSHRNQRTAASRKSTSEQKSKDDNDQVTFLSLIFFFTLALQWYENRCEQHFKVCHSRLSAPLGLVYAHDWNRLPRVSAMIMSFVSVPIHTWY